MPSEMFGSEMLLERGNELAQFECSIAAATAGEGGLVLLDGPAGIGKTALLDAASGAAEGRLEVLRARGTQLEHEFAFGVVRQLFERPLARCAASQRRRLFAGAAGLAKDLLVPDRGRARPAQAQPVNNPLFAVVHGLYWLTVNWCEQQPLMLVVDDAHWADPESLRFLAYLGDRLAGTAVLVAVAVRRAEGESDFVTSSVAPDPASVHLVPAALSASAVSQLVRRRLAGQAGNEFCAACHVASGGNPFLLLELLTELREAGVRATASSAARVAGLHPHAITQAVVARLRILPSSAGGLARAVAILDSGAELRHARALAGLDERTTADALDALRAADVLAVGVRLEFVHPLVARAVYESVPEGERGLLHLRAAELLSSDRGTVGVAAAHLLRVQPGGSADVVALLRRGAEQALRDGAPDSAVRFLRRALVEPPDSDSYQVVLMELGVAEAMAGDPAAYEHLLAAHELAEDGDTRAQIAMLCGGVCYFTARFTEGHELISTAIDELGRGTDFGRLVALECLRAHFASVDARLVSDLEARGPWRRKLAEAAGPLGRSLLLFDAGWSWQQGQPAEEWLQLLDRGLDNGRFIAEGNGDSPSAVLAVVCTVLADEVERAERLLADVLTDAERRGSITAHILALEWMGGLALRAGNLTAAEGDAREALELCLRNQLFFGVPFNAAILTETLLELGRTGEADGVIGAVPIAAFAGTIAEAFCLLSRARVHIAAGSRAEAIVDLRTSGATFTALRSDDPNGWPWRSTLALVLGPAERSEAVALVDEELAVAGRIGKPRAIGVALRAAGLLERGNPQIDLLGRAVAMLERSPAKLELARALTDLGAAVRRTGRRGEARAPLRRALDLADSMEARPLAQRAREELVATGAKPRRDRVAGAQALTAAERRVAKMAADGMTNRDIAQALFISTDTVARHLTHTYQKLKISSRDELAGQLASVST